MYHPTTRVLTVLELLQTYGRIGSAELARRLEVTQRSVRRYITMLQDLGIPVESERGRHGGYRLRPGYKLPPLMFTNGEALAVTLGLLSAERLGLSANEPAIGGALAKLDRVLPESVREQVQAVHDALILDDAPSREVTQTGTVMTVSQAIQQGRRIWIRYHAHHGETARAIDPYGLVFRDGRWYVVGWCHLREAVRIFRLDRMLKLRLLASTFERPEGFDSRDFLLQTLDERFDDSRVEILLETDVDEARQWVPLVMGSLEETPDGVLLTSNVGSLEWMAYFIIGLPWPVRVLQPIELMDQIDRLAERIRSIRYHPPDSWKEAEPDRGRRFARPA